jgi:hypothetical protein
VQRAGETEEGGAARDDVAPPLARRRRADERGGGVDAEEDHLQQAVGDVVDAGRPDLLRHRLLLLVLSPRSAGGRSSRRIHAACGFVVSPMKRITVHTK